MKKTLMAMAFASAYLISNGAYAAGEDGDTGIITFTAEVSGGTCTAPTDFTAKSEVPLGQVGQNEIGTENNAVARPWQKAFTFTDCSQDISNISTTATWTGMPSYPSYVRNSGTATNIAVVVYDKPEDQGNVGKRVLQNAAWDTPVHNGVGTVTVYGNLMRWGTGAIGNGTLNYPVNLSVVYH